MEYIVINEITVIVSVLLLLSALITPMLNGFFRKTEVQEGQGGQEVAPPVSIILTPHENPQELERNLPLIINQNYAPGFEVIVVIWKGDHETEDVLKRFVDDPHLYTTYVPDSARYMSKKKLAITLGVKAAKNEWLVFTDIESQPASDQWLSLMAQHCDESKDIVLGYTDYEEGTSDYRRFEHLHTAFYLLREDLKATPYRHNCCNMLLRKSVFIKGDGFRGNLKFLRGEYDFLVNKYADRNNTAVELHPDSWTIEQEPSDKSWMNKHLFYLENRQEMDRSLRHRLIYNTDQCAQHLNYIFIIAATIYSVLSWQWIITAAAAISLIITVIWRTIIAKKALRLFYQELGWWKIVPYEVSILYHNMNYLIRHHKADKYDFICHKV